VQPAHGVADGVQHPLHLVFASLVERELELRWAEPPDAGGRGAAVVELDALAEAAERVVARLALDLGLVDLLDLVARVREPVRERAVVRQQERARRVRVEPGSTKVFSTPGSPFTRTRPALISSSAPRRDATPARAR
jgi:hypothetical protein